MATVCFGHIGDSHLHLNFLPRDAAELAEARRRYLELAKKAVSLGGTVSAEHGIGRLKKAHLAWMVPPDVLDGWRRLKRAADPAGVLGRGVLFDPS
jgi:FAD/FMN-containing dehydrogenase